MARTAKKAPEAKTLTESEKVFIDEYLIDCNATAAYRRAFPNSSYEAARVAGSRLVAKANIRAEIKAARQSQQQRTKITADRVLKELARIAFSDIGDLFDADGQLAPARSIPFDARRAISSIRVRKLKVTTVRNGRSTVTESESVVEYRFWNKTDALGKLANHLGLTTEIAPLELLLQLLPAGMAAEVRQILAKGTS